MPSFTPNTPQTKLPFTNIAGLPMEAQVQIRRDFEELMLAIVPAASVYDCIIDPAVTSNPATHIYKNLHDAIAFETKYTAGVDLTIGVYQRAGIAIDDSAGAVDISGKG